MRGWRNSLAVVVISGASIIAWSVGSSVISNAQFARAAEEIEATRQQLQKVEDVSTVYKAVNRVIEPAVVSIEVHKTIKNANRRIPNEDQLRRFFPDRDNDGEPDLPENFRFNFPSQPDEYDAYGTGSGVIVEVDQDGKTGYIVTNNHVAGGASEMTITLSDGRKVKDAKLVGADPKSDLAVVKIEAEHLVAAKWGNSDYLEKGDIIMAFGSPMGYVGSMTHGIVSALNRNARIIQSGDPSAFPYENFIQVDAPINPGNSGGPLVNLKAEVVGINTAIASRTGGFQGIGFAIPSNQAKFVYDSIKEKGKVVRGWLGVEIGNVSERKAMAREFKYDGASGVIIAGVTHNAPAEGKLQLGDVITAINNKSIETVDELRNIIAQTPPGTEANFTVTREGKVETIPLKIGEQPDDLRSFFSGRPGDSNSGTAAKTSESLGMRLSTVTDELATKYQLSDATDGALVTGVLSGSPAAMAGLQPGDLIIKVKNVAVHSPDEVREALNKADLSKPVRIDITNRQGSRVLFLEQPEK